MLAAIKEKAQGWLAWVIVIFISIPFALWGINSYFEAQATVIVAEVNGNEITNKVFRSAFEREQLRLRGSARQPDAEQLKARTLNRIVEQSLLIETTEGAGYRVSDAQLQQAIQGFEIFQRDGRFSPDLYQSFVRQQGYRDPVALETEFRNLSIIQQAQDGFLQSAIVTDLEVDRLLALQEQQRKIAYLVVSPKRFLEKLVVSDQEIQTFYAANTSQFRSPEQAKVQYVELSIDDVALTAEYSVSEEEVRQYYQDNLDRFRVEKRRASHILVKPAGADAKQRRAAQDKAQQLLKRLRAGEDFGQLARAESDDPGSAAKGGDLGFIAPGAMDKAFERQLFTLKKGELSEPVRTGFGFHIIRVDDIQTEVDQDLTSVREDLVKELRRGKAADRFYELSEVFRNLVYEQPDSLEPVAGEIGAQTGKTLEIKTSDWFTRGGGAGIAAHKDVLAAAFSEDVLRGGQNSDTLEIETDHFVALRLAGHRPATVRPLAEVREGIRIQLRTAEARTRAGKLGRQILQAVRGGRTLEVAAAEHKLEPRAAASIGRRGTAGLDRRIVAALFAMPRPDKAPSAQSVDLGGTGTAVVVLFAVSDGDPAGVAAKQRIQLKERLRAQRGLVEFLSYKKGLRQQADIKLYTDRL